MRHSSDETLSTVAKILACAAWGGVLIAWESFRQSRWAKWVVFALLLLVAASAFAGTRIARKGRDEVRVFDSPCVSAQTLAQIKPEARKDFRKVQGTFGGKLYFGCWVPNAEGVLILWEDGDLGFVPAVELKPVPEA